MVRTRFSWLLVAVLGFFFLTGCGSGVMNPTFPEVTRALRAACADWIGDDAGIASILHAFEADQRRGHTEEEMYWDILWYAESYDEQSRRAYLTCGGAIIDEIWGD